jgi:hypothetical protein
MSAGAFAAFNSRQNASSRSCREMFSSARRCCPWLIGGRHQQEEEMHRIAIEAVEVDPFLAHRHRTDQFVDARVLRVRHGDPPTDAGGA